MVATIAYLVATITNLLFWLFPDPSFPTLSLDGVLAPGQNPFLSDTKPQVVETRYGLGAENWVTYAGRFLLAEKGDSLRLRGQNLGSWPRTGSLKT